MTATRRAEVRSGFHRPELRSLSPADEERVLSCVRSQRLRCPGCGRRRFAVGDALFLGFLFAAAGKDEHMVALTCRHRGCPAPRTGIRLTTSDIFG